MKLQAIQLPGRKSRAQELYEHLRQSILDGVLDSGDRLVEEQIAAIASVSRTPVREALRKLEADGLVELAPRGAIVTSATLEQLAELCVVRETLEALAARLAAISISEVELATLYRMHQDYEEASHAGDVARLVQVNNQFHEAIYQAARNRYLFQQLRVVRMLIQRVQATTLALPDRREQAMIDHREILDALSQRDAGRAEELSKMHVRRAIAIRMSRLKI